MILAVQLSGTLLLPLRLRRRVSSSMVGNGLDDLECAGVERILMQSDDACPKNRISRHVCQGSGTREHTTVELL